MSNRELSRVCRRAARQIEKDGLCKDGTYGTNDGPKCAIGAMRFVRHGDVDRFLDVISGDELTNLFRRARPRTRRSDIVSFNDAPRTRKHDVVELLRDMADRA